MMVFYSIIYLYKLIQMSVEEYDMVFQSLRKLYDDQTEKIATLEKENASLQGKLATLEKENASLQGKLATLEKENDSLHERVTKLDKSNSFTPSCKELAKKEPKAITEKEIDPNRKILRSILMQISKLRKAVNSRISEMCRNNLETPHLELRKEILDKMGMPADTNKDIYLSKIFSNQSLTEDDCEMFISRGRILEKAYLMILEVYKICNEEDDDVFATLHPGRGNDEDFYAELTSYAGTLDERTLCVTYFRTLLGHGRYQCFDSSDSEDEELPLTSYDGKEIISFCHA